MTRIRVTEIELEAGISLPSSGGHYTIVLKSDKPLTRVRMAGMFFDTNKCFLLPQAMHGIKEIAQQYDLHPDSNMLIVGHTDTAGEDESNMTLSLERAESMAAFLQDKSEVWEAFFQDSNPEAKRWGTHEIQLMLSALPENEEHKFLSSKDISGKFDDKTKIAVKAFQHAHTIADNGEVDSKTRKTLIQAYMGLDGTSLPHSNDNAIKITTHGCGENFPKVKTGDGVDKAENRRVEIFFFDGEIRPAPEANKKSLKGSKPYLFWNDQVTENVDLVVEKEIVQPKADIPPEIWTASSFARQTSGNKVEALVDGAEAMKAIHTALLGAKNSIRIADWTMATQAPWNEILDKDPNKIPDLSLVRDGSGGLITGLFATLLQCANAGVIIKILLWNPKHFDSAGNHGESIQKKLEGLHANIKVSLHDPGSYWSHHQKFVIVDGKVAFLGGVDLAAGRWDTPDHSVVADKRWSSTEFYNPCLESTGNASNSPRMPWHDVHLRIEGPSVADVDAIFAGRWNFQNKYDTVTSIAPAKPIPDATDWVQIHRSANSASCGLPKTEHSILDMYLNLIKLSQHHIHIENQFFTSHFGTSTVENTIADALVKRIGLAIKNSEDFRVTIVLPAHPEGPLSSWDTQETMHWQYQTLIRSGAGSFLERIRALIGPTANAEDVRKVVSIHCLRNYGNLAGKGWITEQIYVHIKCMIVDDSWVVIGSANINDRSMLGNRDSEIAGLIADENEVDSFMKEKPFKARAFARKLRVKLWKEHLNIDELDLKDPFTAQWNKISGDNTIIYESVFPKIPRNSAHTLPNFNALKEFDSAQASKLSGIKGHLCDFPLQFLDKEDLEASDPRHPDKMYTLILRPKGRFGEVPVAEESV